MRIMTCSLESLWIGSLAGCAIFAWSNVAVAQPQNTPPAPIVLHAARLLNVATGEIVSPGEVLVEGERIKAVGKLVDHPQGAKTIDLGDTTLLPGLIDAHVHLFLHPGAEDLQTVEESTPWRTIMAEQAAKADLMGGYTAERDMGTEGAGSADSAIRDAIDQGLIPGPTVSGSEFTLMQKNSLPLWKVTLWNKNSDGGDHKLGDVTLRADNGALNSIHLTP